MTVRVERDTNRIIFMGMNNAQAVRLLRQVGKGACGFVTDAVVTSRVPELSLCKNSFAPQPFHALASENPLSFTALVGLLSKFGDRMIKAWVTFSRGEKIQHEISISNRGVSRDGMIQLKANLQEGIESISAAAPRPMKSQIYFLGKNAGFFLLGVPGNYGNGISAWQEKAEVPLLLGRFSSGVSFDGAIGREKVEAAVAELFERENFLSIQLLQPALSVLTRWAIFYRSGDAFTCELLLQPSTRELSDNLQGAFFPSGY